MSAIFPPCALTRARTPFYFYDEQVLNESFKRCATEMAKYGYVGHYAVKANAHPKVLQYAKKYGIAADCVSGNEVKHCLQQGINPNGITFAGVGKTDEEIRIALEGDIFCFNCESLPELEVINQLASEINREARVALRINPNVDAHSHHYITTGIEENKFGINLSEADAILEALPNLSHIKLIGLHFHIGSQITDLGVFKTLCTRVNEIQQHFATRGLQLPHINLGGGLGVNYQNPEEYPQFAEYFAILNQFLKVYDGQTVHVEPGRCLVAQCCSLISKVTYVKKGANTQFAIIDAGMNHLIRPALYQAYHKIENISSQSSATEKYDVVGPVCESSDCFGKAVELPLTQRADRIAIRSAGAYGQVMSSNYNLRDKADDVFSGECQ